MLSDMLFFFFAIAVDIAATFHFASRVTPFMPLVADYAAAAFFLPLRFRFADASRLCCCFGLR